MMRKNPLKPFDVPVIAFAAALSLTLGWAVHSGESSSSRVVIQGADKTWIFPLGAEECIAVSGPAGETLIEIRNGQAAIVSSPCGGQTCVAAGGLHRNGQWAACLPNRVLLLIEGNDGKNNGNTVDAASW